MRNFLRPLMVSSLVLLAACQKSTSTAPVPQPTPTATSTSIKEVHVNELALRLPTQGGAIHEAPAGTYLISSIRVYSQEASTASRGGIELNLEFPGVFGPGAQVRKGAEWGTRIREYNAIINVPEQLNVSARTFPMNRGLFSFERPKVFQGQFSREGQTYYDLSAKPNSQAQDLFWIFNDRYRFPSRPGTRTTHYRYDGGTFKVTATSRLVDGQLDLYIGVTQHQELLIVKATFTPTMFDGN